MGYYAVRRNVRIPVYATVDEKVHQKTVQCPRRILHAVNRNLLRQKLQFHQKDCFSIEGRPPANKILKIYPVRVLRTDAQTDASESITMLLWAW